MAKVLKCMELNNNELNSPHADDEIDLREVA